MSEVPEGIWAWEYKGNSPWGPVKPNLDVVKNGAEYIRADRIEALEAQVRAADALAEVAERAIKLSQEHDNFKLYAMEPMWQALAALKGKDNG